MKIGPAYLKISLSCLTDFYYRCLPVEVWSMIVSEFLLIEIFNFFRVCSINGNFKRTKRLSNHLLSFKHQYFSFIGLKMVLVSCIKPHVFLSVSAKLMILFVKSLHLRFIATCFTAKEDLIY